MSRLFAFITLLAWALWLGGLITLFLCVITLFHHDRSLAANVAPKLCAALHNAWQRGDVVTVQALNERLMPLHLALFTETSPAPVKYAASLLGLCTADVRLPLCEIQEASKAKVREAMVSAGLLSD